MAESPEPQDKILITDLLKRLWPADIEPRVTADEIAFAIGHVFDNKLSPVQTGALLTCLHFTGRDRHADVIAKCATAMREAAAPMDFETLKAVVKQRGKAEGNYHGGLCDIVGTGGDSHHTFNISTTSSILASSLLLISKHGNRASTSKSGSADLLQSTVPTRPNLLNVRPDTITEIYGKTNYAFLFAPVFHQAMKYVAPIRKQLGWRTIFNLLGPLANPLEEIIEARLIGVARHDLGATFAEALQMSGAKKGIVACGAEDLDEVSCAGETYCWMLEEQADGEVRINPFTVSPADFGLPSHPLSEVSPGKEPAENAAILTRLMKGEMDREDPIIHFVLMNTAALLVASGICEADTSNMGHGDDGKVIKERGPGGQRWKEGVRRARWAIDSGEAYRQWNLFVDATNEIDPKPLAG